MKHAHTLIPIALCAAFAGAQPADGSVNPGAQNNPLEQEIIPELDLAINAGIRYLAQTQEPDGSWASGRYGKNVAITSLACLALMSDGHIPGRGELGDVVDRGVEFILNSSADSGLITSEANNGPMYGHGFATLFLGEVYGMTPGGDDARANRLHEALVKAVRLIEQTQNDEGGWRYNPVPYDADVSVTISLIMALRSARNAGIEVNAQATPRPRSTSSARSTRRSSIVRSSMCGCARMRTAGSSTSWVRATAPGPEQPRAWHRCITRVSTRMMRSTRG